MPLGATPWTLDWMRLDPEPGKRDKDGVQWLLMEEKGFWGSPGPDVETSPRLNTHGVYRPPAYKPGRTITLKARCYARDYRTLRLAEARIGGLLQDPAKPGVLTCYSEFGTLTCDVHLDGEILCEPLPRQGEPCVEFNLQLLAPDPRKYSVEWQELSTGLASEGDTGLDFQQAVTGSGTGLFFGYGTDTDGLYFGEGNASGFIQLRNPGSAPTRPVYTLYGPLSTPTITAGGRAMRYNGQLGDTEYLVIDPGVPSVLLGGTVSRRHLLAPADFQAFAVPPSPSSGVSGMLTVGLSHSGSSAAAGYLHVRFRPAYF